MTIAETVYAHAPEKEKRRVESFAAKCHEFSVKNADQLATAFSIMMMAAPEHNPLPLAVNCYTSLQFAMQEVERLEKLLEEKEAEIRNLRNLI